MINREKNGIKWLEFELLQEIQGIKHAVFLRQGGVSEGPFSSLNAGGNTGDVHEHVRENRLRMQQALQFQDLISTKQVHGCRITAVTDSNVEDKESDSLVTSCNNKSLMIKHADCQAAILYDPIKKVVANVHCGWRGNVQNIYSHTINYLKNTHQSQPQDIFVCISPSLGPKYSEFIHYKTELPKSFWEFQWKECMFNLWEISRSQLIQAGILSHHIEIACICTYEREQDYFSYRRDRITGRNATIVSII